MQAQKPEGGGGLPGQFVMNTTDEHNWPSSVTVGQTISLDNPNHQFFYYKDPYNSRYDGYYYVFQSIINQNVAEGSSIPVNGPHDPLFYDEQNGNSNYIVKFNDKVWTEEDFDYKNNSYVLYNVRSGDLLYCQVLDSDNKLQYKYFVFVHSFPGEVYVLKNNRSIEDPNKLAELGVGTDPGTSGEVPIEYEDQGAAIHEIEEYYTRTGYRPAIYTEGSEPGGYYVVSAENGWYKSFNNLDTTKIYYAYEIAVEDKNGNVIPIERETEAGAPKEYNFAPHYLWYKNPDAALGLDILGVDATNSVDVTTEIGFTKIDGNGAPLSGAKFRLYNSYSGAQNENTEDLVEVRIRGTLDSVVESEMDGRVLFNVDPGVYYMKETDPPNDNYKQNEEIYILLAGKSNLEWNNYTQKAPGVFPAENKDAIEEVISNQRRSNPNGKDKLYAIFKLTDGRVSLPALNDPGFYYDVVRYGLMNTSNVERKIILRKVDASDDRLPLSGAQFTLFRYDMTREVPVTESSTDGTGAFYLGKLPLGTYYLWETKTPDDSYKTGQFFKLEIGLGQIYVSQARKEPDILPKVVPTSGMVVSPVIGHEEQVSGTVTFTLAEGSELHSGDGITIAVQGLEPQTLYSGAPVTFTLNDSQQHGVIYTPVGTGFTVSGPSIVGPNQTAEISVTYSGGDTITYSAWATKWILNGDVDPPTSGSILIKIYKGDNNIEANLVKTTILSPQNGWQNQTNLPKLNPEKDPQYSVRYVGEGFNFSTVEWGTNVWGFVGTTDVSVPLTVHLY